MAKKKSKQTSMRNKWLFIGAAFVVMFVIFYAALPKSTIAPTQTENQTATPTSNPATADWKAYTDASGIFSFKYPSDWNQNGDKAISMPADPSCPHCAPGPGSVSVTSYENPSSLPLSKFLNTISDHFGGDYYIKYFKPYSIPGVKDAMLNPTSLGAYDTQEEAVLNSGKTVVSIFCSSRTCSDDKTFEKILSTFKFIQ